MRTGWRKTLEQLVRGIGPWNANESSLIITPELLDQLPEEGYRCTQKAFDGVVDRCILRVDVVDVAEQFALVIFIELHVCWQPSEASAANVALIKPVGVQLALGEERKS
jgi:hypothetical protein